MKTKNDFNKDHPLKKYLLMLDKELVLRYTNYINRFGKLSPKYATIPHVNVNFDKEKD